MASNRFLTFIADYICAWDSVTGAPGSDRRKVAIGGAAGLLVKVVVGGTLSR